MNNFFEIIEIHKGLGKGSIIEETRSISYKELYCHCNSFSSFLKEKGISEGDCVCILLPNSIEFAIILLACFKIGSIAVPINPSFKKNEIQYHINDSTPKLIFTTDLKKKYLIDMKINKEPEIISVIGKLADVDLLEVGNYSYVPNKNIPDIKSIYLYSTGSTGVPKRVSRTHKNLLSLARNHSETVGLNSSENILFTLPISHTYALGNFLSALKSGVSCFMLEEFNRKKVVQIIQKQKITIYPCVPFILKVLAESSIDPNCFSSLKLVISAGAPLSKEIFDKFSEKFHIHPRQLYGSSETGVISINLSDNIVETYDSVGRPVKGVTVKIIKENGEEANPYELGEITVKSEAMTSGYDNIPEETERVFKNGTYHTGDLGYIDEKGLIFIKGRIKLMINIDGNKVDPIEIETILNSHPAINESAVTGISTQNNSETLKAYIVASHEISVSDILNFLKQQIADFKIPKNIVFVGDIPKSSTGKILRNKLS